LEGIPLIMYNKQEEEFCKFLKGEIEPILFGELKETAYRASVYLLDNTYIPCVLFRNSYSQADRAIREFESVRKHPPTDRSINYRSYVRAFTTGDNIIASDIISKIETSPYAIPVSCYNQLASMMEIEYGGVSFQGRMDDDKKFDFFIDSNIEFIEMPKGYVASQIVEIIPHARLDDFKDLKEKFYFNCYLDCIHYP
jgi:hypothetical protein